MAWPCPNAPGPLSTSSVSVNAAPDTGAGVVVVVSTAVPQALSAPVGVTVVMLSRAPGLPPAPSTTAVAVPAPMVCEAKLQPVDQSQQSVIRMACAAVDMQAPISAMQSATLRVMNDS